MKRIKKFLRDRRGVAIEFAIGVMFLTVAVSTVLLTTALRINSHRQRDIEELEQKIHWFDDVIEEAEKIRNTVGANFDQLGVNKDGKVVNLSYSDGAWTVISIEPQ